jgi:hypothetical protein
MEPVLPYSIKQRQERTMKCHGMTCKILEVCNMLHILSLCIFEIKMKYSLAISRDQLP